MSWICKSCGCQQIFISSEISCSDISKKGKFKADSLKDIVYETGCGESSDDINLIAYFQEEDYL